MEAHSKQKSRKIIAVEAHMRIADGVFARRLSSRGAQPCLSTVNVWTSLQCARDQSASTQQLTDGEGYSEQIKQL